MLSRIENLWRLSTVTFQKSPNGVYAFNDESFASLKNEMDRVTAADVCLEESLSERRHALETKTGANRGGYRANAPVTFIDLYSGPSFSICIFVLHKGSVMPIHDHPSMHGILKVLTGEVKLDSYTVINQEPCQNHGTSLIAEKTSTIVRASDPACVLTPKEKNLHALSPVSGSAAFMDILSPPYCSRFSNVQPNPCNFYKEASHAYSEGNDGSKVLVRLVRTQLPKDYWCDTAVYKGPVLSDLKF